MNSIRLLILIATFKTYNCNNIDNLFEKINKNTGNFNAKAAEIAWESSINPGNQELPYKAVRFEKERITWQQETCGSLATLRSGHFLNSTQARQTYLLCRGPKYTFEEARLTSKLYEELQSIYNEAQVCIPSKENVSNNNGTKIEDAILKYLKSVKRFLKIKHHNNESILFAAKASAKENFEAGKVVCLKGEDDFQKIMAISRNEDVLKWLWLVWREKVGPPMIEPFRKLVDVENVAARRNGYPDIGASWRDEQEIPNLRQVCRRLHDRVRPLYSLLHGVVRFFLRRKYGDIVPKRGAIPAHLLGNLWSQNWEPLADLIVPNAIDLDESIKKLNWTVDHMAKRAEDFYQSLGLPPMTDTFWQKSVLSRKKEDTRCHGAAADMFKPRDFRLLYCASTTKEDFYVLHHELGHIQYYMAYEQQPALFRQANTALHEAIGDTIMYGVLTPQHLHRLGLINDSVLYSTSDKGNLNNNLKNDKYFTKTMHGESKQLNNGIHNFVSEIYEKEMLLTDKNVFEDVFDGDNVTVTTDDILVLKQALDKIPQIPFALLIDEYRWRYFEGDFTSVDLNSAFWQMAMELQGIAPPMERGEEYFDIGAKFHVPDNTPYVRYFLSSFLQHQLFESLCKAAVFGRRDAKESLPDTISMNRCDIYGSKTAGRLLKDLMSRGHSQHWQEILQETTGQDDISAASLERYYRPLYKLLMKLVGTLNIPIGW